MANPFRNRIMRHVFDTTLMQYDRKHINLFNALGFPRTGNAIADPFWRGFAGKTFGAGFIDPSSKKTFIYVYWKAGQACAKASKVTTTGKFMQPHEQCAECPFSDTAAPGWFGPYKAQDYLNSAMSEHRLQCHITSTLPVAQRRHCTGVALFRRVVCKEPRNPEQVKHQDACVALYGTEGILTYAGFIERHIENPFDKEN